MTALSVSRSRSLDSHVRNNRGGRPRLALGPVTLSVLTIGLIGFMALFYVVQASISSTESFKVHSLEVKGDELREQNRRLEVEASQLRALDNVQTELDKAETSFVPVTKLYSVTVPDDAVATRSE